MRSPFSEVEDDEDREELLHISRSSVFFLVCCSIRRREREKGGKSTENKKLNEEKTNSVTFVARISELFFKTFFLPACDVNSILSLGSGPQKDFILNNCPTKEKEEASGNWTRTRIRKPGPSSQGMWMSHRRRKSLRKAEH